APARHAAEPAPRPPLAGVRAVVLTHAWLGTFCTELLGLAGADVIQVEARKRPDTWRAGYQGVIPAQVRTRPTARHAWNCSPLFNSVNLNKRGITLDLDHPEGRDLFKRLVARADVVAENYSPRVVHNLGVDYESLRAVRSDLIMLSLNAYGASGPWRDVVGIGGTIEPTSGMSSLLGYPGGPPLNSGQMLPDPVGGWYGFGAIVTALRHRDRTGEGQYIDLSMQESNQTLIGDAMLEALWTGRARTRLGNRHPTFAPHGIYPAQGEEQWVALAAEDDAQWRALCEAAGAGWERDVRFASNEARKASEDALDAAIAAWTATQARDALAPRLAAAGVPAAPVRDALEVAACPVFRERGRVVEVAHPETGTWWHVGVPATLERTPGAVTRPSPCLGEHSAEVLAEELGVSEAEYAALVRKGVTGEGPPD
ncbi:MAG: CoA transferase, partial [Chloroflexi bacterium]|nr:CoA transferase [Chloroflexota bacterium]